MRVDGFPSSEAFEAINSSLQSDDAGRKDAVKKGNAVFSFTLKNKEEKTESWHIDLKDKGVVAKGEAPAGKKADGKFCPIYLTSQLHSTSALLPGTNTACSSLCTECGPSFPIAIRRRFREAGQRQDAGATVIHVGKAEDQGRHHEGDEDGANIEESADQTKVVNTGSPDQICA